jgi:hypothetical protein
VVELDRLGRAARSHPTQAWLAGDSAQVTSLVESWYAAGAKEAERAGGDPDFLAMLRRKLAELEDGPLNRSV